LRVGLVPRRLPPALVRFACRKPGVVAVGAVLVWVAVVVTASRLQVETDILSLVPRGNPVIDQFSTTVERFGSVDTMLVVVRLDPDRDFESSLTFVDALARSMREWDLIDWVEYRLEDPTAAAVPLLDRVTLFLEADELEELIARLSRPELDGEAERLRSQLLAPQGLVTKELLRVDPFGLLPRILERVRFGGVGVRIDPTTGCLVDPGRTMMLMLAKPTRPAPDLDFDRLLASGLGERLQRAEAAWREEGWEGPRPEVEFTGGHMVTLEDSDLIRGDVIVNLATSLAGVMILFGLAFRRAAAMLYAVVPLMTGLGLTLVFGAQALGRLNTLTSASGALLIGLGIDFIIVSYGRYVEERTAGVGHLAALETVGSKSGVPVLLGAVTTAATFYAFLVTDFRGLWELGLLTGTGILLVALSVFLLLPVLLRARSGSTPRLYLHSFGSDILCRACLRRPVLVVAVVVLVTLGLGWAARGLSFDDDISNMRSAGNRASQVRDQVMSAFGMRFSPMMVRLDGATEVEAIEAARRLMPELEALVDDETLASVDSIVRVVPPVEEQAAVIDRLRRSEAQLIGLEERFARALRAAGLSPEAFQEGVAHTVRALRVREPMSLSDLAGTPLERMVGRYLVRYEGGYSTAVYCYPPAERWRRAPPPALLDVVARHPAAALAGTNVVSAELRRIVWGDAAWATVLGLALVLLLLWADLGSPVRALLALVPTALGALWMLGAMAALGLPVNFLNIFVATMLVGIGVDYGVHLVHRWQEVGCGPEALGETAKAIAVAALTTMVGFGSLVTSHFPGLRSVGAAALLGTASTALLSITLLPVLLAWAGGGGREVAEPPERSEDECSAS